MDAEEIQKRLTGLSQRNFKRIVALVLKHVLNYDAINIDGSGDGGSDWIAYEQGGQRLRLALQDTVQAGWEKKAVEDAKKAKTELGVNSYMFFTNRTHQQTTTAQLESKINRETGLSCNVFEARRIAELIFERGLGGNFLEALGDVAARKPPGMPEMCLAAYGNMSADRSNHRDEIYNDTIRIACFEASKPLPRKAIIDAAINLLATSTMQRPQLAKQLDQLISKGELCKSQDGSLELSTATRKNLSETEQLYLSDWAALETAQIQLMKASGASAAWTTEDSQQAAVYISRMFLQQQLEGLRRARIDNIITNWSTRLGNPEQQLRDLLQQRGIHVRKIPKILKELTDLARGRDVLAKLTRTVTFVALEGRDPALNAAALGRRSWDEINILIDSSVAIPFLCEQLNETSETYHFALSGNAVRTFQDLNSHCFITAGHLEECAAHLIQAYRYQPVETDKDLLKALRLSENAFIAYFGSLKEEGKLKDQTLPQFLAAFSRRAVSAARESDLRKAARAAMPEIQSLLTMYNVSPCRPERKSVLTRFGELQRAFDLACLETGRDRQPILREHDVDALAHAARSTENEDESWMMLTWDKTFIHVAEKELPLAFVVSPEMAMDFAQPCRRLSDTQLCALAHRLARISSPSDELAARILDQVTRLDPEKLKDAIFRRHLLEFREQAIQSLPTDDDSKFHAWIEGQASMFLKQQNIGQNEREPSLEETPKGASIPGETEAPNSTDS